MTFDVNKIGFFRGNPEASTLNNIRLGNIENQGTPGKDTGTLDATGFDNVVAVQYTGKDGVSKTINLFDEERPNGNRRSVQVASSATGPELQKVLHRLINSHEVDPVVAVTKTGNTFTVEHIGSGTLSAIITNAGSNALTRGAAASVVGTNDEPTGDVVSTGGDSTDEVIADEPIVYPTPAPAPAPVVGGTAAGTADVSAV